MIKNVCIKSLKNTQDSIPKLVEYVLLTKCEKCSVGKSNSYLADFFILNCLFLNTLSLIMKSNI